MHVPIRPIIRVRFKNTKEALNELIGGGAALCGNFDLAYKTGVAISAPQKIYSYFWFSTSPYHQPQHIIQPNSQNLVSICGWDSLVDDRMSRHQHKRPLNYYATALMGYMHNSTATTTNHANLSLTLSPRLANLAQLNRYHSNWNILLHVIWVSTLLRNNVLLLLAPQISNMRYWCLYWH